MSHLAILFAFLASLQPGIDQYTVMLYLIDASLFLFYCTAYCMSTNICRMYIFHEYCFRESYAILFPQSPCLQIQQMTSYAHVVSGTGGRKCH